MENIMARSEGFILPALLILLLILSLVLTTLYQVEGKHFLVYQAVKMDAATEAALPDLEKQVLTDAQNASLIQPNPTDTPEDNTLYLRAQDSKTHETMWQERKGAYQFLLECDAFKHCKIRHTQRLT